MTRIEELIEAAMKALGDLKEALPNEQLYLVEQAEKEINELASYVA